MEKFLQAVDELSPEKMQSFYKAIHHLKLYAYYCTARKQLPISEESILFRVTVRGLAKEYPLLWTRYLYDICEAAADRCIDARIISSHDLFFQIFSQPIREKEITPGIMVQIFDIMAIVIKEKFAELQSELKKENQFLI